ncbi:MAG: flagellar export chaperone FliS [Desulfobacteraceae bacterium 4572_19]|nr:MAG: flagellar export chaperone FliS [Desulfobacteraceae bacterium 4572_19]
MVAANGYNTYLNNHYEGMDPKRLILMLFNGALKHLKIAREGVIESNPQKRGEGIGKVIDIITELQSSLDSTMQDESTNFLRGLYASMLVELSKASINNDIKPIDLSVTYISRLKEIWTNDVMQTKPVTPVMPNKQAPPVANKSLSYGKQSTYGRTPMRSFSA